MKRILWALALLLVSTVTAMAGDLPTEVMARFIKQLGPVVGSTGKAMVKDAQMLQAVQAVGGVEITESANLVYCATPAEVRAWKGKEKKIILVPKLDMLPLGGAIAVIEENGKPQIYLHVDNYRASGLPLTDLLLKIGKPAAK